MSITDIQEGLIYQIGDVSGTPIFWVNSNGVYYYQTIAQSSLTTDTDLVSIDYSTGTVCYFDYRVSNSGTGAYRAGTVMAVWDGSNVEFTDTSTADIVASTAGVEFSVAISGANVVLTAVITTGTWSIKIGSWAI